MSNQRQQFFAGSSEQKTSSPQLTPELIRIMPIPDLIVALSKLQDPNLHELMILSIEKQKLNKEGSSEEYIPKPIIQFEEKMALDVETMKDIARRYQTLVNKNAYLRFDDEMKSSPNLDACKEFRKQLIAVHESQLNKCCSPYHRQLLKDACKCAAYGAGGVVIGFGGAGFFAAEICGTLPAVITAGTIMGVFIGGAGVWMAYDKISELAEELTKLTGQQLTELRETQKMLHITSDIGEFDRAMLSAFSLPLELQKDAALGEAITFRLEKMVSEIATLQIVIEKVDQTLLQAPKQEIMSDNDSKSPPPVPKKK